MTIAPPVPVPVPVPVPTPTPVPAPTVPPGGNPGDRILGELIIKGIESWGSFALRNNPISLNIELFDWVNRETAIADTAETGAALAFYAFDYVFGTSVDLVFSLLASARDVLAGILGLPTVELIEKLAVHARATDEMLHRQIGHLRSLTTNQTRVIEDQAQRIQTLQDYVNRSMLDTQANFSALADVISTLPANQPNLVGYVDQQIADLRAETYAQVQQMRSDILNTVPQTVDDLVTAKVPVLLDQLAPALVATQLLPITQRLTKAETDIATEEQCCATNNDRWANQTKPALDQLSKLKPLMDLLSKLDTVAMLAAFAGLFALGPDGVAQLVRDYMLGPGESVVNQVADWLT